MIYTVQKGDTLYSLAERFNVSLNQLIEDNGLNRPNDLAIGQNLIISTPSTYTVQAGDTLFLIAQRLNMPLERLLSLNPQITNPNYIQIGQVINTASKRDIEVNGYAIANIQPDILNKTLPYLTYLSLFSYQAKPDGTLTNLYETQSIDSAINQNTMPVMVVTNIGEPGGFDSDLASTILNTPSIQQTLINNILSTLSAKNYTGVDIDFEYIYPNDRGAYNSFLHNLKSQLPSNTKLSVAVAPKYRDNQSGLLYEAHDYRAIGEIADRVIIMTYEWGYLYGEPMAISPLSEVEAVISYATTRIPPEKILMGMPNYAYDWTLPYRPGTSASTLTNNQALELALDTGSTINWDTRSASPYFNYNSNGDTHVVWFDDPRSINERLNLVEKYNLAGISIWTINNFFAPLYSILSNRFNIVKF